MSLTNESLVNAGVASAADLVALDLVVIVVAPDPASNSLLPTRLEPVLLALSVLGESTSGKIVGLLVDPLHSSTVSVSDTVVSGIVHSSVPSVGDVPSCDLAVGAVLPQVILVAGCVGDGC